MSTDGLRLLGNVSEVDEAAFKEIAGLTVLVLIGEESADAIAGERAERCA